MSVAGGYLYWTQQFVRNAPILDGYTLADGFGSLAWNRQPGPVRLRTLRGTDVMQSIYRGASLPLSVYPMQFSSEIGVSTDDDFWRVTRAAQKIGPVSFFCECWIEDVWHIPSNSGGTTWYTSRALPYNGTTITHTTHAPLAYIDTTAKTVVTGAPGAGEVKVPATSTGPYSDTITTPALTSSDGTYLVVRYPPMFYVTVSGLSQSIASPNDLRISLTLDEVLGF